MTPFKIAALFTTAVAAVACSESMPTSPSPVDATSTVSSAPPVPAPVSQTLTGTWTGAGQQFTVTQNGAAATGMIAPTTINLDGGITLTASTMISGAVAGDHVTLWMNDRVIIRRTGVTVTCTEGSTFTGALEGNTLSGRMVAGTTPRNCGGDAPPIELPELNGPVVYTRQ